MILENEGKSVNTVSRTSCVKHIAQIHVSTGNIAVLSFLLTPIGTLQLSEDRGRTVSTKVGRLRIKTLKYDDGLDLICIENLD